MRLLAISDLHLGHPGQRTVLDDPPELGDDWLIVAGDIGERPEHLERAFEALVPRCGRLIWVPGNHELWRVPRAGPRGEAKYEQLVALCRRWGVVTPEDPYPVFEGEGGPVVVVPLFVLYDYSFRPDHLAPEEVLPWAAEHEVVCTDEYLLDPHPHASREAWCAARLALTERRLEALDPSLPTVLVSHFPLRYDLVRLPRIPRFSPWCGTRATEDWHLRYRAKVLVSGHLHVRGTLWRDGVRCEEVSLGYPWQWDATRSLRDYVREILPGNGS